MSSLRFNHVFLGLLGLFLACGLVLPARVSAPLQGVCRGLFYPVAAPVRFVSAGLSGRVRPETISDDGSPAAARSPSAVTDENHRLRTALASLQLKFDELSKLNADRQAVGDVRSLCRPATVAGVDSAGFREALVLTPDSASAAVVGRPVIRGNPLQDPFPCDLVGKVETAGVAGATVRLITDPGFSFTVRIGRYVAGPDGRLQMQFVAGLRPLVRGSGGNSLTIRNGLSMAEAKEAGIGPGDVVVLDDRDGWPANVQGFEVGKITSVRPQPQAPLFATVRIEPAGQLMRLGEVMVVVKD